MVFDNTEPDNYKLRCLVKMMFSITVLLSDSLAPYTLHSQYGTAMKTLLNSLYTYLKLAITSRSVRYSF